MDEALERFKEIIKETDNIVFFGGAGVSTESGIPDFRSQDGLYNQKYKYPPEQIVSHTFLTRKPEEFFEFYKDRMIYQNAKPNKAHIKLAKWEEEGKLKAIVTQNIDGLHQAAGSKTVLELHGSTLRNYCLKCGKRYDVDYVMNSKSIIPYCDCGGMVRPDVVLYEEGLDMGVIEQAVTYISNADVLIIGGTSLAVYPAAGLIDYYKGDKLIVVNKSATPRDSQADLLVQGSIGEIFDELP